MHWNGLRAPLADEEVPRVVTARAAEALGPTHALDRLSALRFGAEVAQEFGDRHAGLELDLAAGHRGSPSSGELRL